MRTTNRLKRPNPNPVTQARTRKPAAKHAAETGSVILVTRSESMAKRTDQADGEDQVVQAGNGYFFWH